MSLKSGGPVGLKNWFARPWPSPGRPKDIPGGGMSTERLVKVIGAQVHGGKGGEGQEE